MHPLFWDPELYRMHLHPQIQIPNAFPEDHWLPKVNPIPSGGGWLIMPTTLQECRNLIFHRAWYKSHKKTPGPSALTGLLQTFGARLHCLKIFWWLNMVFHGKTSLKRALVRTALFLNIAGRLGKIFIRSWLSEQEHWTTRKNARLKQLLDYWLSDRVIHLDFQNTSSFP